MLEIFALIFLTRHLKKTAQNKYQSPWWAAIGPVLWIVFELVGVIAGIIITGDELAGMGIGIVSALIGAGISLAVVHSLPSRMEEDDMDEFGTLAGPSGSSSQDARDNVWAG